VALILDISLVVTQPPLREGGLFKKKKNHPKENDQQRGQLSYFYARRYRRENVGKIMWER
jgi:hypothetical protein